jgi:hypothetical protein
MRNRADDDGTNWGRSDERRCPQSWAPNVRSDKSCDITWTTKRVPLAAPDALNRIGLATLTTLCAPDAHEATALSLLRFGPVGLSWGCL